jgi:hypothetical protein
MRRCASTRPSAMPRGFTCWGQFLAMLFCQLASVNSLCDITNGLAASEGKVRHLGLPEAPRRSTLAYANSHRPWQVWEDVFYHLLDVGRNLAQQAGIRHKFRFKNKLLSIDASAAITPGWRSAKVWARSARIRSGHRVEGCTCTPPLR